MNGLFAKAKGLLSAKAAPGAGPLARAAAPTTGGGLGGFLKKRPAKPATRIRSLFGGGRDKLVPQKPPILDPVADDGPVIQRPPR